MCAYYQLLCNQAVTADTLLTLVLVYVVFQYWHTCSITLVARDGFGNVILLLSLLVTFALSKTCLIFSSVSPDTPLTSSVAASLSRGQPISYRKRICTQSVRGIQCNPVCGICILCVCSTHILYCTILYYTVLYIL